MKKARKLLIFLILLSIIISMCSCSSRNKKFYDEFPTGDEIETIDVEKNPEAVITLEDGSKIELELHYYAAPNAVADFIALAGAGVYDGMAFNEVRNKCIVMTGASEGEFSPPYYVMDEIGNDESKERLSHKAGVVSMIRTSSSDTLTGQFFILTKDQTHFDSRFTSFGTVTSGMDIIEKIAASELDENGKLTSPYIIKSVKINTHGNKFPNPTIIPIE